MRAIPLENHPAIAPDRQSLYGRDIAAGNWRAIRIELDVCNDARERLPANE
jgi:hypothetical protein